MIFFHSWCSTLPDRKYLCLVAIDIVAGPLAEVDAHLCLPVASQRMLLLLIPRWRCQWIAPEYFSSSSSWY